MEDLLAARLQMAFVLLGLTFIQFPYLMHLSHDVSISVYESSAPQETMSILFWSLMIGVCIIIPALIYLMLIFKRQEKI